MEQFADSDQIKVLELFLNEALKDYSFNWKGLCQNSITLFTHDTDTSQSQKHLAILVQKDSNDLHLCVVNLELLQVEVNLDVPLTNDFISSYSKVLKIKTDLNGDIEPQKIEVNSMSNVFLITGKKAIVAISLPDQRFFSNDDAPN
jgi:hypothetical protein